MTPAPDARTTYYVRNETTGAIVKKQAVVPTLPHDRLGGTVYGFATEAEYLAQQQPAPIPTPRERADLLRKVYRYFRLYGRVTATDVLMYDGAIEELRKLGWRLNEDQTDWLPPGEAR